MLQLESESVDAHELVQKVGKERGISPRVLTYLAGKRDELRVNQEAVGTR